MFGIVVDFLCLFAREFVFAGARIVGANPRGGWRDKVSRSTPHVSCYDVQRMKFFGIRSFAVVFFILGSWLSNGSSALAGTCTVLCSGAMATGGGGRSSSISHSFEVPRRSQCMGVCPTACQNPPGSWVGVPRDGSASCVGAPVFSGSEAPVPPVVDGTCEAVCGNDYMRDTLYFTEPERIRTTQDCATRCQEACRSTTPPLGAVYGCIESSFHAPRGAESTGAGTTKGDCPWWEQEDGVCPPDAGGSSNKKGAAARRTTGSASASSGNCTFNGVHDPFCGKTIPQIIGNIVRFLLGAAGALFLAMFVYGGAVWLTAGSSDRHEEAQKTLVNAATGILVVIASYTMVSLLVRFAGGLGASQSNEGPRLEEASQEAPPPPAPQGTTPAAPSRTP